MNLIEVIENLLQELEELELSNLQARTIGFEFLRRLVVKEPYQLNEDWEALITKYLHKLKYETDKKASEPTRATSPSKKEPNTRGRPGKIDKGKLRELKEAKWSDREIANYFGVKEASVRQAWYRMRNVKTGHCGVYAIYRNSELVYIRSTIRSFTEREFEHRTNLALWLDKRERRAYIYTLFSKFDEFTFKILEDFGELDATKESPIRQKERELIARYKPIGNVASNPLYKDF